MPNMIISSKRCAAGEFMRGSAFTLSFIILSALAPQGSDGAPPESEPIRSRIQLISQAQADGHTAALKNHIIEELHDKSLEAIARTKSFSAWKKFEDEQVMFRYPANPHISVEVKSPGDAIAVMGSPVRTSNITFVKCYRLALGKHTYALLLFDKADSFDDGCCFCGAVLLQKYLFHNDALYRFDFLKGGDVKRAQMLRNGYRIVMFEWTHLPISQDVYVEFALGITLKTGSCDQEGMRKAAIDKYGFEGRLGFMEKGMARNEVIALLGTPLDATDSSLKYVQTKDRWQETFIIPLDKGVFREFGDDWRKSAELPAERGTVDWIAETVGGENESYPFSYKACYEAKEVPLPQKEIDYIFNRFTEIGPTAQGGDWDSLCHAIRILFRSGHEDKRVLQIIRNRFMDTSISQHAAAWLLHEYDPVGSQALFAKRTRLIYDDAQKMVVAKGRQEAGTHFDACNELHNLLSFLDESHPQQAAFIREGMDHPHPDIRSSAYIFWDRIPPDDARPRLIHGLEDDDDSGRQLASRAFKETFGTAADVSVLRERLSREKDEEVLDSLKAAISRLAGGKQQNE